MSFGFGGFENFGGFDPSQLLRFLQFPGSNPAQMTAEIAKWVALDGGSGERSPVDSATDAAFRELAHAAQLHVVAATGLATSLQVPVHCVDRAGWVDLAVPALQPVLDHLSATLHGQDAGPIAFGAGAGEGVEGLEEGDPESPFAGFLEALAPMLLGVQSGFMVGYLARHAHAQHDLLLPAKPDPGLVFVVENLDEFEQEWSLARDELRFFVAINEVVHAAILAVPWVAQHHHELSLAYVGSLEVDRDAIESQLAAFDPAHPESMQEIMGDPGLLLAAFDSPGRRQALDALQRFTMVVEGFADYVLDNIGRPLIPGFDRIAEARQRHRVERGDAQRFIERLLGIEMEREHYERGSAFCAGVVERAGADALAPLWEGAEMLPTAAELVAPGLWLARLEVME